MRYASWRLAMGERGRNLRHLLAVTLGIALAAFVLLEAFATSNALSAQSRVVLMRDGSGRSELEPDKVPRRDDLLLRSSSIVLTRQGPLTVTLLARQGTGGSFDLPGLSELPPVGSVLVSPALAGALSNGGNAGDELRGWLPAAPTGALGRAGLASPTELVAIAVVRPAELRRSGRFEFVNPANPLQL